MLFPRLQSPSSAFRVIPKRQTCRFSGAPVSHFPNQPGVNKMRRRSAAAAGFFGWFRQRLRFRFSNPSWVRVRPASHKLRQGCPNARQAFCPRLSIRGAVNTEQGRFLHRLLCVPGVADAALSMRKMRHGLYCITLRTFPLLACAAPPLSRSCRIQQRPGRSWTKIFSCSRCNVA